MEFRKWLSQLRMPSIDPPMKIVVLWFNHYAHLHKTRIPLMLTFHSVSLVPACLKQFETIFFSTPI